MTLVLVAVVEPYQKSEAMRPCVPSVASLTIVLKRHPCFMDNTVLDDVAVNIVVLATHARYRDLKGILFPSFEMWKQRVTFLPRPNVEPNVLCARTHVREYLRYHSNLFVRDRHCIGIKFATFVPLPGREVGVVWTTTRKAYMFEYTHGTGWELSKILNRQDDPFQTWLRHLRGDYTVRNQDVEYGIRSADELFFHLVVPFFGTHPKARNGTRIPDNHPVWDLVMRVSKLVKPIDDPERFVWRRIC